MGAVAASPARPPDLGGFRSGRRGSFFQPRSHAAPLAAGLRGSGRRSDLAGALAAGSRSPLAGRFWRCCPDPWQYTGFTAFCGGARRYAARADGRADFFPFPCPGCALDASRFALTLRGSAFLVQSRFFCGGRLIITCSRASMPRSGLRQKAPALNARRQKARGKIPRAVMKKGMSMKGKSFAPHKTVGQALCVAASAP